MLMYLMLYRFNLFCQFVSFIYQKSNVQNIDLKKSLYCTDMSGLMQSHSFFSFFFFGLLLEPFWSSAEKGCCKYQTKDVNDMRERGGA